MEIICAGYWKTGSKSCSNALRMLGYKVADFVETANDLTYVWADYIEGKCPIEDVIARFIEILYIIYYAVNIWSCLF